LTSAADGPEQIATQARDAVDSASEAGGVLPPAIEDGGIPAYDLGEYHNPLVVLVSYEAPARRSRPDQDAPGTLGAEEEAGA
jgi:hypothetical protein